MNWLSTRRLAWTSGAIFGLLGVIAGALGAHALQGQLAESQLQSFETAVRFQMYHALLLIIIGNAYQSKPTRSWKAAALLIILGTIAFSGSIYLLVLYNSPVGIITPIGGVLLIMGWAMCIFSALKTTQSRPDY